MTLGLGTVATPAQAAVALTGNSCAGVIVGQLACSGFYELNPGGSNLLGGDAGKIAAQIFGLEALDALVALEIDTTDFDFNDYPKINDNGGSFTIDFPGLFVGPTVLGVHFGNGAFKNNTAFPTFTNGKGGTAFFLVDAGAGVDTLTLNLKSSSGVVLYGTGGEGVVPPLGVPEPATWGMMLMGFFGIGSAVRASRRRVALAA